MSNGTGGRVEMVQARLAMSVCAEAEPQGGAPSDEELALLLDDRLDFSRRREVLSHLNNDAQLYARWLQLAEAAELIYAPRADLRYIGNMMVDGSLFARSIHGIGNLMVRYDAGLQGLGEDCDEDQPVDPDQLPDPDDDPNDEEEEEEEEEDCDPMDDACIEG